MLPKLLPSRETRIRFVRFVTVGGTAAVVQFASLAVLKRFLGPNLAFTISFVMSTTTHYLLNRFWALPSYRQDSVRQLSEYLLTAGLSYIVNLTLFKVSFNLLGFSVMWSAVIALPPSTLLVFLLLNYRVFKQHGRTQRPE